MQPGHDPDHQLLLTDQKFHRPAGGRCVASVLLLVNIDPFHIERVLARRAYGVVQPKKGSFARLCKLEKAYLPASYINLDKARLGVDQSERSLHTYLCRALQVCFADSGILDFRSWALRLDLSASHRARYTSAAPAYPSSK